MHPHYSEEQYRRKSRHRNTSFNSRRSESESPAKIREKSKSKNPKNYNYSNERSGRSRTRTQERLSSSRSHTVSRSESSEDERRIIITERKSSNTAEKRKADSNLGVRMNKRRSRARNWQKLERESNKKKGSRSNDIPDQNSPHKTPTHTKPAPEHPVQTTVVAVRNSDHPNEYKQKNEAVNNMISYTFNSLKNENEELKKESTKDKLTIAALRHENECLKTSQETFKKLLEKANNRATCAELAANEARESANKTTWRKMALTQNANLQAMIDINNKLIEDTVKEEDEKDFKIAKKQHSNSLFLPGDIRLPTKTLLKWSKDPMTELRRKSHDRNYVYIEEEVEEKKCLRKIEDEEGKGDLIGEFNLDE